MFVSTFSWGQTFIKVLDAVNKNALACKVLFVNGEGQADSSISEDGFFSLPIENPQKVQIVPLIPIESTELYVQPSKKYVIELKDPLGIITKLGEVVVTDIHSNKTFDNTVLNVSKITAKRIEELGAIDLKDALSFENNIRFSRDNAIGSSGLSMMGIGGENVKVLIDGVPVIGRLFNNVDLEQFNLENVKQIEVVKGPMSVIYGSNALAGTINIVTSNKSKKPRANLNGNYETDGQYNLTGTFSKSVKNHYFTLSGGRTMFTGWSAENIDRTFDWIPKEQYTGRFQYTYKHKDASINVRSEMIRSKLIDRGTPLAPYRESAIDQYYNNQRFDNSLSYHNKIGESSIQIIASNNYFNRVKNKYLKNLVTLEKSIIPRAAEQDTQTFNASVLRAIYGFDRKKTLGIETLIGFDGNVETGTGDRIDGGKQSQLDAALFVSAEKKITSYFLMRGGLRYAYNSAFESPLLYSLQTRFTLPNSQVFKLAVGKGFRAPSLKELYLDLNDSRHEVFGNPNLQSETSHSLTGSYTKYFKSDKLKFATNVEGFYNDIVDKIDLVVSGPISAKYYNIGVFRSVGGGINQKVEGKKLAINTSFNYTGIYNGIEGSQKKYYFSPQLVVNPTMKFPKLNGSLNLFFNYFGASSRVFSDSTGKSVNLREQDAYSMLDLTYNKSFLNKKLRIGVGARNILNVITIDSNNTEVGAHTPSTSYVSVSPGRTYFINVRYEFFKK